MPQQPTPAFTILVVEDDPTVRFLERYLLEDAGYTVVVANNGDQALELAPACQPDLVVLDVGLPTISGLEVLHVLSNDATTRGIPVMVVSAYATLIAPEHRPLIAATLSKPFEQDEFLATAKRVIAESSERVGPAASAR
jgi:two-component system, chemotaxis family, chemotaxis protein CheY